MRDLLQQAEEHSTDPKMADKDDIAYRGVKLTHVRTGLANFKAQRSRVISKVTGALDTRFKDIQSTGVNGTHFAALKLLNTHLWPRDEGLNDFGHEEIELFLQQFHTLLDRNGVDTTLIPQEWIEMKSFYDQAMKHLGSKDVWKIILTKYRDQYPNLCHVIEILSLYPVSNAKVERGFSVVRRVKSDWRSKLNTSTLNHLLFIDIEGPPVSEFDATPHVRKFFSKRRHPNVAPYGPSKRKVP